MADVPIHAQPDQGAALEPWVGDSQEEPEYGVIEQELDRFPTKFNGNHRAGCGLRDSQDSFPHLIKRWPAFQDILDARLSSRQPLFARMTGREQALFLADEFRKAGSSVLPAVCPGSYSPRPLSQKLSRLLQAQSSWRQ